MSDLQSDSGGCFMITLYKDQSKNDKLKAVIADLRSKIGASDGIPWSFKYFHPDGKVRWLMEKYDIKSKAMAKKFFGSSWEI